MSKMRMLIILTVGMISFLHPDIHGQGKYMTNNGFASFYSHTVIEDITAENKEVASVIDASTGEVVIIVRMSAFQFEKRLMQEHFNENYVESEKYPKATFNGAINNNQVVDYSTEGTYKVVVEGDLTIHGITNTVSAEGTIEVTSNGIVAKTSFMLNPEEYDIRFPRVVRKNIADNMEIRAAMEYIQL